jgi:hypothetical protein
MTKELWHPTEGREVARGVDIKKLISDRVSFVDSREELLIQVADILTGFMRRVLAGKLVDPVVNRALGRLMIRRRRNGVVQTVKLITFTNPRTSSRHTVQVVKPLARNARAMIEKDL